MAHICSFNPAEVGAGTARAYFPMWDGRPAAVMISLLETAAKLKTMSPQAGRRMRQSMDCCWSGEASTSIPSDLPSLSKVTEIATV